MNGHKIERPPFHRRGEAQFKYFDSQYVSIDNINDLTIIHDLEDMRKWRATSPRFSIFPLSIYAMIDIYLPHRL